MHPDYEVHEVGLSNGKIALRVYTPYDRLRAYWAIDASSKHVDEFRAAIQRAANRAADVNTLARG